ncbi:hypothetical protein ACEQPO_10245 [Bacillus sp. SL00103]
MKETKRKRGYGMSQAASGTSNRDTVGVIAPASPPDELKLAKGIAFFFFFFFFFFLESLRLKVKKGSIWTGGMDI